MWWCDRCLLQLFPKLMGDANFDWHSRFRWDFGIFRSDLRHSQSMIMCGQFNHKIIHHRLFVTGPFMAQFVREVPDRNIPWNRVTRVYLIYDFTGKQWQKFVIFWLHGTERQSFALLCFCGTERQNFALLCFCGTERQNFALRCFHGSDYQRFTLKSVTSLMWLGALVKGSSQAISASRPRDFQGSTTRTEQGIGLLTIPVSCSRRPIWTSQICAIDWQHLSWKSHFCKLKTNLVSFLGWRTQAANHNRRILLTEWEYVWHFKLQTSRSSHSGVKAAWALHFIEHLSFPWYHRQSVWF